MSNVCASHVEIEVLEDTGLWIVCSLPCPTIPRNGRGRVRETFHFPLQFRAGLSLAAVCQQKSSSASRTSLPPSHRVLSRLEERSSVLPPIKPTHYAHLFYLACERVNACGYGDIDKPATRRQCTTVTDCPRSTLFHHTNSPIIPPSKPTLLSPPIFLSHSLPA